MFENTFKQLGKVWGAIEDDFKEATRKIEQEASTVQTKRHRIVSKDGVITITGDFKEINIGRGEIIVSIDGQGKLYVVSANVETTRMKFR